MRVNIEDDLWTSGRLSKLARTMKWNEREALGALVCFYRRTQIARLVSSTADRLLTIIVLDFDSDEQADAFINALISAQLVSVLASGELLIKGNAKRIEELDSWFDQRVAGGKGRAASGERDGRGRFKKPNDQSSWPPAGDQLSSSQSPGVLSPMSLVLSPKNSDLLVPQAETRKPKRDRSPEEKAKAKLVRDAFHAGYQKRYGHPVDKWGAPENAHVYHLLKSSSAEVLAEKAKYYFAWTKPEVIKAGHPFMDHSWSFSRTLHELRADMIAPERRGQAAQFHERQKLTEAQAVDDDGANRINAILAKEREDARILAEHTRRTLEQATPSTTGALGQGSANVVQGPHAGQSERRGDNAILPVARTVRQRNGDLVSAGNVLRGRQNAEHSRPEEPAWPEAGAVQGTARPDTGRAKAQ